MNNFDRQEDMTDSAWQAVANFNNSARADVAAIAKSIDTELFKSGSAVETINATLAFTAAAKQKAQTIDGASRVLLSTLDGIASQDISAGRSVPKKLDEIRAALSKFAH